MKRKIEAHISQSSMSHFKTIYVEGNLDGKIINEYILHKKIKDVRVTKINIETDDSHLPVEKRETSKTKVINIIKQCNSEGRKEKVLGIIDLDYDFFQGITENISNLCYTDFNSMESYFLNENILNKLLEDYDIQPIKRELLEKWKRTSLVFSSLFYYQLCEIDNICNTNKISFKDLSLDNECFVNFKNYRINIRNLISYKTKCNDIQCYILKFINFLKSKHPMKYRFSE